MDDLRRRALFTEVHDAVDQFEPAAGSVYLFASSEEERSHHANGLAARASGSRFIRVEEVGSYEIVADGRSVGLRSASRLEAFLRSLTGDILYLDMTGMSHSVWAPLVRVAVEAGVNLRVVYVEPDSYAFSKSPREGEYFELSESKIGMGPLPLFASMTDAPTQDVCFVPLLGFEGARLKYLIEQVQPQRDRIIPIVGMPGFRPEYPFHALQANGRTLMENGAVHSIRYARANCPFSCYYVLSDILLENPSLRLKVATIGTKPHALGAVLRASRRGETSVELIYDHVRRKPKRTFGTDHCLVYDVSGFLDALEGA